MDSTQKMLQAIIHGQDSLKQDLIKRLDKLDKTLSGTTDSLEADLHSFERNLNKRLDVIDKYLSTLVEKRVIKIEQKPSGVL